MPKKNYFYGIGPKKSPVLKKRDFFQEKMYGGIILLIF